MESVSPEVKPCYAAALRLAEESGGAFNPRIGERLRALGMGGGKYSRFDLGAIAKGYAAASFHNVSIYPLICYLLGIRPSPNDGNLDEVRQLLR